VQIRDEVVMWWNLSVGPFGLGQVTSTISLSEESDRGDTKRSSFDCGRQKKKKNLLTTMISGVYLNTLIPNVVEADSFHEPPHDICSLENVESRV